MRPITGHFYRMEPLLAHSSHVSIITLTPTNRKRRVISSPFCVVRLCQFDDRYPPFPHRSLTSYESPDMGFRVFQVADQGAYFVVLILCALSSIGAIVLRFLATHRSRRKPGAEDWFSLAAVLLFLARIGLMLDCKTSHIQDTLRS